MKTEFGRARPGTLKDRVAALAVGESLPCTCRLQRNTLYIVARRLGVKLKSENNTMKRIQ